ncbi:MAG: hypothetical protein IJO39_06275 [Clostridia bacterium]|nr:hypothetical protein [Clostridia bacterium]
MEDMESFFEAVIVFFGIIISLVASAKKAKNKRVAQAAKKFSFPEEEPAPAKAEHPYPPAQPTVLPPMEAAVPQQVIAPTVHTHVQPDCDTHDAPNGSLGVTTSEGKDPCHEPQLTHARSVLEHDTEVEGGLTFDWLGQNMVKAFVMQEILTRPCQRQAR